MRAMAATGLHSRCNSETFSDQEAGQGRLEMPDEAGDPDWVSERGSGRASGNYVARWEVTLGANGLVVTADQSASQTVTADDRVDLDVDANDTSGEDGESDHGEETADAVEPVSVTEMDTAHRVWVYDAGTLTPTEHVADSVTNLTAALALVGPSKRLGLNLRRRRKASWKIIHVFSAWDPRTGEEFPGGRNCALPRVMAQLRQATTQGGAIPATGVAEVWRGNTENPFPREPGQTGYLTILRSCEGCDLNLPLM